MENIAILVEKDQLAFGEAIWSITQHDEMLKFALWRNIDQLLLSWPIENPYEICEFDFHEICLVVESMYEDFGRDAIIESALHDLTLDLENQEIYCDGLRSMCKSIAGFVIEKATSTFVYTSGVDVFLEHIKIKFEELVGDFKDFLFCTFGWLQTIWNRFRDWAAEILKSMCGMAYHILDGIVCGIVIVGAAAMLYAIEKFLKAMGMLNIDLNLSKMFLVAVGALLTCKLAAGTNACGAALELANTMCVELVAYFPTWQWSKFFPGDVHGPFGTNNQNPLPALDFNPIDMLTQMATTMGKFSSSTVIETGKFFAAVEAIKRGLGSMKDISKVIFQFFCDLLAKMLGRKSQFLQDATALIGYDVAGWMNACDALMRDAITGRTPADVVLIGYKLLSRGRAIKEGLASSKMKLSNLYAQQVVRLYDQLSKIVASLDRAGDGGPRRTPFVVAFVGPSRTGKSELRQIFEQHFLKSEGFAPGDVFTKPRQDDYWTGYHHQAITSFDDLGASSTNGGTQTDEVPFIDLVSGSPLALNMASLEEKGTFFTSPLITYSSNFERCSPHSGVKVPSAFNNRRNVVVRVERNGVKYDPKNLWKSQTLKVLNPTTNEVEFVVTEEEGKSTYDVLFDYIKADYDVHTAREIERIQHLGSFRPKLGDELRHQGKLLRMCNQLLSPTVGKIMAKLPQVFLLGCYKGRVWGVDHSQCGDDGEGVVIDLSSHFRSNDDFEAVKLDCEFMITQMSFGVCSLGTLSEISRHYFEEMITTEVMTIDLDVNQDALIDPSLLDELRQGPKWFRALVASLNECYYSKNKKQGFISSALESVGEKMYRLYAADVAQWPLCMKVLVGFTMSVIFGGGAYMMIAKVVGAMQNPSKVAETHVYLNSDDAKKKRNGSAEGARITFRSRGVKPRFTYLDNVNTEKHLSLKHEDAILQLMEKFCVELKFPNSSKMAIQMPGRRLRLLSHYVRDLEHPVLIKIIYGDGRTVGHNFNPKNLKFCKDVEICEYECPTLNAGRASLYSHFEFDPLTNCGKTFPIVIAGLNTEIGCEKESFVNESVATVRTEMRSFNAGTYLTQFGKLLVYPSASRNGDCGSLVMAVVKNQLKIVGLHVGGDRVREGYASMLPYFPRPAEMDDGFVEALPFVDNIGPGLTHIGKLKSEFAMNITSKSAYEKTPVAWHFGEKIEKEPAILHKTDPRAKDGFDPFETGIKKYANNAGQLDADLLERAACQMFEQQRDILGSVDDAISLDEAINGYAEVDFCEALVMSTSEGFPHILERQRGEKGKFRYFEGPPGFRRLVPGTNVERAYLNLRDLTEHQVPTLVSLENVKDEKLPLRKIYDKPKSRLFSVLPVEYNLLARELFLPYMSGLMSNRSKLPSQVGINAYSFEWNMLAVDLLEQSSRFLCCDYSGFDGLLTAQILSVLAKGINGVIAGKAANGARRYNLLMGLCSRLTICGFKVYEVQGGLPSGFALTVILNSLMNELLVRYYYLKIMAKWPLYEHQFNRMITLKVYGDDNLIAVHPTIERIFTGKVLKETMALDGITITDGTDKTLEVLQDHPISEVDFLQRKFVRGDDGHWYGPLNRNSLMSQLQFVKTKEQSLTEAYKESAENVLREMYLHGPKLCQMWREKFLSLGWLGKNDIPTLESIRIFHQAQRGLAPKENAELDFVLTPELVGAFCEVKPNFERYELTTRISVCSYSRYALAPNDFPIYLACGSRLKRDDSMHISYDIVHGRGMLPTLQWFRTNILRKSEIQKRMACAYAAGKHLVFISPDQIVKAYIFCVMFLLGNKLLDRHGASEAVAIAVTHCASLGYIVTEGSDIFVN